MKSKILLMVTALIMLVSLLGVALGTRPASAGTLVWSAELGPSASPIVNQLVSGSDVTDLAVASDGATIYAVDSPGGRLFKSTDAGTTWSRLTVTGLTTPAFVAVAPGDANMIMVTGDGTEIYLSTDGGISFNSLAPSSVPFTTINDIAISPWAAGIRYLTLAGVAGGVADIQYLPIGGLVSTWTSIATSAEWASSALNGTVSVQAIAYSPNFAGDKVLTAVTNGASNTYFELLNFSSRMINAAAGFPGYPVTVLGAASTKADISLAPTYLGADESLRTAFIAVSTGAGTGKLARYVDTTERVLSSQAGFASVDFNGTYLVAGSSPDNRAYYSSNPLAATANATATTLFQRPGAVGTTNTMVAWAGANAVAGTSGSGSAFSISKDKGVTFNDVSLIDGATTNLTDVAVSMDGNTVYLASNDGANTSIWRRASAWERILTLAGTPNIIIRSDSVNATNVYLVQTASDILWYSDDSGEKSWVLRAMLNNAVDVAVESAQVLYALSATGKVSKSYNSGFTWDWGVPTGLAAGATITSVAPNQLLVGGADGLIAWSSDGGAAWTAKLGVFTSGHVQATADNLTNGFIYAASSTANQDVKRWRVGVSTFWSDAISGTITGSATGISLNNGALYVLSWDGTNSYLARHLKPNTATSSSIWSTVSTSYVLNRTPKALVSSAGKLWAINDASSDTLASFSDTVAGEGPTLISPAEGYQDPVNPVTGRAWDIAFYWNRLSLSTDYQLEIARDSNFLEKIIVTNLMTTADPIVVMVGPFQPVFRYVEFMPGATYYWRVKTVTPLESPWSLTRSFSITPLGPPPPGVEVRVNAPSWAPQNYDFTVTIDINHVENFDAASYQVSFNATALRLDNVTAGQIGSNGSYTEIPVDNWVENVPGTVTIVQNLAGMSGVSGSGNLARMYFRAIGPLGSSSILDIKDGTLSNNLAQNIIAQWLDGNIYIANFKMGDANGDGVVNALDITKVERIIAGLDP